MFYAMAKLSDFWLIYTEARVGTETIPLYLAPGSAWKWCSDPQDARRFQYSFEALTFAYDNAPFTRYRSFLDDGYIELDFEHQMCHIHRGDRTQILTLDTLYRLKDLAVPTPKKDPTNADHLNNNRKPSKE
jgi:hypothetical protein